MKIRIDSESRSDSSIVFRVVEEELNILREHKELKVALCFSAAAKAVYELRLVSGDTAQSEMHLENEQSCVRLCVSMRALEQLETLEGRRSGLFATHHVGDSILRYGIEIDLKPKRRTQAVAGENS